MRRTWKYKFKIDITRRVTETRSHTEEIEDD